MGGGASQRRFAPHARALATLASRCSRGSACRSRRGASPASAPWAATNDVTLVYDSINDRLTTTVVNVNGTFNDVYPNATPPTTLSGRITSFGKTFNVGDLNGFQLYLQASTAASPIEFTGVEIDGNPIGDFSVPGGGNATWRATDYDFSSGFTLTGTLLIPASLSGQESNKLEITVGHEAECGDGSRELGEDCDDGNLAAGDCCSPACTRRPKTAP